MHYQFGNCELDTEKYELRRAGKPVALRVKATDLLAYLVEHAGRRIEKNELIENIWEGRVISDATLNSSIREVRHAIGDNGTKQQYIKTIYGKGYRFTADITINNKPSKLSSEITLGESIPCPYPGMVSFGVDDARYFHGRENEVAHLLSLLRNQRFIMVIGPSGSGKSSLIQAGLMPALQQKHHSGFENWLVRNMRPGSSPYTALEQAIGGGSASIAELSKRVTEAIAEQTPATHMLIVVDQFEEVFTQATANQASKLFNALKILRDCNNITILLTLRADFYPNLMDSSLWPIDPSQRIEITPLRGEALRRAIVEPAASVGVEIESSLIESLLIDSANEPGVLPLLQETLRILWDDIDEHRLNLSAYKQLSTRARIDDNGEESSGIATVFAMKADAVLADLSPSQVAIARRVFLRLIQFGQGRADTRRQQALFALKGANDDSKEFTETIDHLTNHRLVTVSSSDDLEEAHIDIAHESLISSWGRIRRWIEQRREAEETRRRLEERAKEWQRLGLKSGGLLDETELPEAERWLNSADAEDLGHSESLSDFVLASKTTLERAHRKREETRQRELAQTRTLAETEARAARRFRALSTLLTGVFILAVGATVFALHQREAAEKLAEQEAFARQEAESRRNESEKSRALAEQLRKNSIAQLLLTIAPQQQAIHEHQRSALMARQAFLMGDKGSSLIRNLADRVVRKILRAQGFGPNLAQDIDPVVFSPDGRKVVAASRAGDKISELLLWNLDQHGNPPTALAGPTDRRVHALAFQSNGKTLVTGDRNGVILKRNVEQPHNAPQTVAELGESVWSLAFNRGNNLLAAGSKDSDKVWLIDLDEENYAIELTEKTETQNYPDAVLYEGTPVTFSEDGKFLAAGSYGGEIRLWQIDNPQEILATYSSHAGPVLSLVFSPDGKYLASGGQDRTVRIWDLDRSDKPIKILDPLENRVTSLAFRPDGHRLLIGDSDRVRYNIHLWDLNEENSSITLVHRDLGFNYLSFDRDRNIAAVSDSGPRGLRLIDLRPSGHPQILTSEYGDSFGLAFSPDDHTLAAAMKEDMIQLWDLQNLRNSPTVLKGHKGFVGGLSFDKAGKMLSSVGNDKTARLWRIKDRVEEIAVIKIKSGQNSAPFGPNDKSLAIVEWDGVDDAATIKFRDIADMKSNLAVFQTALKRWVVDLRISPDGKWLAAAGREGIIHLEDLENPGKNSRTLVGHEGLIWTLAFSPDSNSLATGSRDRTVRIWDLTKENITSKVIAQHDDDVVNVRFSKDGRMLASSSWDQSIQLRDLFQPEKPPKFLMGQDARVWALAFSHDGNLLASGGGEKGVLLWDLTHKANNAPLEDLIDSICHKVWRNMTIEEWRKFVSEDLPYEQTCPNLPPATTE